MNCNYKDGKCGLCGRLMHDPAAKRNCHPGLGDIVSAGLSSVGITKERVEAVVGGPCGCTERQEHLNALGRRIGIGRRVDRSTDSRTI